MCAVSRGGRGAGRWHERFAASRPGSQGAGPAVSEMAAHGMLTAAGGLPVAPFGEAQAELEVIKHLVPYVSGLHDVMIPAHNSYVAVQHLANATLVLCTGAGRAFLFQYAKAFTK